VLQAQVLAGRQGFVALKAIELFKQVIARHPSSLLLCRLVRATLPRHRTGPFRPARPPAMAAMLMRPAAGTLQLDPLLAGAAMDLCTRAQLAES
jgi:hypothetical protein